MTLLDSTGVSIFVDILSVELTNTVFVNSTNNISTNIETSELHTVTLLSPTSISERISLQ